MQKREELKGKSFGRKCLIFFLTNKKECWYYTGKITNQIWAKMECNLFSETLISNIRRKEIKNVFESIKLH